jgi:hypothetical protein
MSDVGPSHVRIPRHEDDPRALETIVSDLDNRLDRGQDLVAQVQLQPSPTLLQNGQPVRNIWRHPTIDPISPDDTAQPAQLAQYAPFRSFVGLSSNGEPRSCTGGAGNNSRFGAGIVNALSAVTEVAPGGWT